MVINDLPIGSKLVLGRYSISVQVVPVEINWIKASYDNDFISDYVIDYLPFDAKEESNPVYSPRSYGNADYKTSNIFQFLNSEQRNWYSPAHPYDSPPDGSGWTTSYVDHYGFLNNFYDYEIESLTQSCANDSGRLALIHLPHSNNIIGDSKFPLFKRKGIRTHASENLRYNTNKYDVLHYDYCSYFVCDEYDPGRPMSPKELNRAGKLNNYLTAKESNGIRPICRLKGEIEVQEVGDKIYKIKPFEPKPEVIHTNEEFLTFLGLA